MPVMSTDDRSRVELAARINLQKQAKVPRLDIAALGSLLNSVCTDTI